MMQLRLEHKVRMPKGTYMLVDDLERPQPMVSRDEMMFWFLQPIIPRV